MLMSCDLHEQISPSVETLLIAGHNPGGIRAFLVDGGQSGQAPPVISALLALMITSGNWVDAGTSGDRLDRLRTFLLPADDCSLTVKWPSPWALARNRLRPLITSARSLIVSIILFVAVTFPKRRNADRSRWFQKFWPCFVCEGHQQHSHDDLTPFCGWNSDCQSPRKTRPRSRSPSDSTSWIGPPRSCSVPCGNSAAWHSRAKWVPVRARKCDKTKS